MITSMEIKRNMAGIGMIQDLEFLYIMKMMNWKDMIYLVQEYW